MATHQCHTYCAQQTLAAWQAKQPTQARTHTSTHAYTHLAWHVHHMAITTTTQINFNFQHPYGLCTNLDNALLPVHHMAVGPNVGATMAHASREPVALNVCGDALQQMQGRVCCGGGGGGDGVCACVCVRVCVRCEISASGRHWTTA